MLNDKAVIKYAVSSSNANEIVRNWVAVLSNTYEMDENLQRLINEKTRSFTNVTKVIESEKHRLDRAINDLLSITTNLNWSAKYAGCEEILPGMERMSEKDATKHLFDYAERLDK